MRMLIVGPPGAGKGTQAEHVARALDIPAISTGQIFRTHIAAGTDLGKQVQAIMNAGGLVSDEITNQIVVSRLAEADAAQGFLLDGYPRNLDQVGFLDEFLAQHGQHLDVVLELTADDDEVVSRMLKRAQIEGRADDTEDVIRHRMEVYRAETAPLTDAFRQRGILVTVDGMGEVVEVTQRIMTALASHLPSTD